MGYKRLFIWVEGPDDVRFFDTIIKPIFEKKYNLVEVIPYAEQKREKVDSFLRSIKSMNADYIYLEDINTSPCVTDKRQKIQDKLKNIDSNRIIVIIMEIESWYLAGLDDLSSKKLGIKPLQTTDSITKEQFSRLIPKKFNSRVIFILEILKHFSIEVAKRKNRSFKYFAEKHKLRADL